MIAKTAKCGECGSSKNYGATNRRDHHFSRRQKEAGDRDDHDVERGVWRINNVGVPNQPGNQKDIDCDLESHLKYASPGKAVCQCIGSCEGATKKRNGTVFGHSTSRLGVPVQKEMANSSNETTSRPSINHQSLRPRFGFCSAIASEAISSKPTTWSWCSGPKG